MTIKSILKTACLFLNKEDLCEKIDATNFDSLSDAFKSQINFLLKCLNLTYQEVASDYIPLLKKESISVSDNKILLSDLSKKFLEVVFLRDKNGKKLKFKVFPDYIEVNADEAEIIYKYLPTELTSLSTTMESFSNKVSEITLAFGVAMEYSFINGLHEDAAVWEKRFKDALFIRSGKKNNIKLPVRRWF